MLKRLMLVCALLACGEEDPAPEAIVYPRLIVRADQKQEVLSRRYEEPSTPRETEEHRKASLVSSVKELRRRTVATGDARASVRR